MDVRSTYKGARISARKVRDVTREIQGLPVSDALDILAFTPRKAARFVAKTVKAAVADAENNFELSVDNLVVKEATAGEGPTMKRFMPRARGSASPRCPFFRINNAKSDLGAARRSDLTITVADHDQWS